MSSSKTRMTRRAGIDRPTSMGQTFAIAFVDDRQGSKAAPIVERVCHEVERPRLVQHGRGHQRAPYPMGEATFRASWQIKP